MALALAVLAGLIALLAVAGRRGPKWMERRRVARAARPARRDGPEAVPASVGVAEARGLRLVGRPESLGPLLGRAGTALEGPLASLWAHEVIHFPGFTDRLVEESAEGRAALRVLRAALAGVRGGAVPLSALAEGHLGEAVARMADRPRPDDPLQARVLLEGLRHLRRSEHAERFVPGDAELIEALHAQYECLSEAEPAIRDALARSAEELPGRLRRADSDEQIDLLGAVDDLRIDAGEGLWLALPHAPGRVRGLVIRCLRWSADPAVVPTFCAALREDGGRRRGGRPERLAMIAALRHHPSAVAERELIRLADRDDEEVRAAALASLGWWEPVHRDEVTGRLHRHRRLPAARAALARLGERRALKEVRASLTDERPTAARLAIRTAVEEGLSWLWPDLDRLADAEELEVAFEACEALEQLREQTLGPLC